MLPTTRVFAAAGDLGYSGISRVLTVHAAILAIFFGHTRASTVCALPIVGHTHPRFSFGLSLGAEFNARTATSTGQARQGAVRTTIVRRRSPNVSTSGLSNCIG